MMKSDLTIGSGIEKSKLPVLRENQIEEQQAARYWNEEQEAIQKRKNVEESLRVDEAKNKLELEKISREAYSPLTRENDHLRQELGQVNKMYANTYELALNLEYERDNAERALKERGFIVAGAVGAISIIVLGIAIFVGTLINTQYQEEMRAISTNIQTLKDNRTNLDTKFEEFKKLSKEFKDY